MRFPSHTQIGGRQCCYFAFALLTTIGLPLTALFIIAQWPFWPLSALLIVSILLRLYFSQDYGKEFRNPSFLPACILSIVLVSDVQVVLYWYPTALSFIVAAIFLLSLLREYSLVELIARRLEPDIPLRALRYCRWVTVYWSAALLINGGVSGYLAVQEELSLWAYYNGLLSYCFFAVVFSAEYVFRVRFRRLLHSAT